MKNRNKNRLITNIYKYSVLIICTMIISGLFLIGLTSTSAITLMERVYFLKDNVLINILLVVITLLVVMILANLPFTAKIRGKINSDERLFRMIKFILAEVIFALTLAWVLSTQYNSWADANDVREAAKAAVGGSFDAFLPGGYMEIYHNQYGLFLFDMLLELIFKDASLVAFQVINAFSVFGIYLALDDIAKSNGMKESGRIMLLLLGVIWYPVILYASFCYGNIPSLVCALWAVAFELKFLNKGGIIKAAAAGLLIALAVALKGTSIIFLIGMFIYALIAGHEKRKYFRMIFAAALVLVFLGQSFMVKETVAAVTKADLSQGQSAFAWIAMGLQESDRAPGWFNEYNAESYAQSGYNTDAQAEMAKENIGERIESFTGNKVYAASFFLRKIASSWNEPTFQSVWILRGSDIEIPKNIRNFDSIAGYAKQIPVADFMYMFILLGVLLFLLFGRNDVRMYERLLLPMIFVGGFVFLLFWEAKAQYSILYFICLLPTAVEGWSLILPKTDDYEEESEDEDDNGEDSGKRRSKKEKEQKLHVRLIDRVKKNFYVFCALLLIVVLSIAFSVKGITADITDGDADFEQYVSDNYDWIE
ncbi:MAG: hypothetical protein MJ119_02950 [Lachnospiraceae bacterium]|nr:hypothetical protein [Lachnospiraceae bacterium]